VAIKDEFFCIPDECRDQHLVMVPKFAAVFKERGIRGVGVHEVVEPYQMRRLTFPWHMVLITLSGSANYECQGKTGTMKANEIWVGPAHVAHDYRAVGKWKFISEALFMTEEFVHLEAAPVHRHTRFKINHLASAVEAYLYESLLAGGQSTGMVAPLANFISNGILRELRADSQKKTNRLLSRLDNLWEMVNASPGTVWNVADLSQSMNVSTRQFQRLMQANYGFSAEKMLRRIRMEHAAELLKGTQFTADAIAERIGYESVYAFSRAFKRYYGIPPGRYRKDNSSSEG